MEAAPPALRNSFQADARAALEVAGRATTSKHRRAHNKIFGIWTDFCNQHGQSPTLHNLAAQEDKLTCILVFLWRYRATGQRNKPVRSDTLSGVLTAIGQGISRLGQPDPRFAPGATKQHPLLADFLHALSKEDDPSVRAYPANVTILRGLFEALDTEHPEFGILNRHVQLLTIVAFYWLLRPAEYLNSPDAESRSQAYLLRDIHFTINDTVYNAADPNCPLNDETDVRKITFATLLFSDQKNAVRGEQVGHRATSDDHICPAKALGRLALHLRRHQAEPTCPIFRHFNPVRNRWYDVKPQHVTNALRHSANATEQQTGITSKLLSARSLRPGGATALLCAGVDSNAIQLLGRWKSDAMLRYLRIQATSHAQNYAQRMLDHGSYTFHPQTYQDAGLPNEAPPAVAEIMAHDELFHDP